MQLMRPRVYKKHADSIVFASANAILVMVLVVGTCWEATAGSQVRPAALPPCPLSRNVFCFAFACKALDSWLCAFRLTPSGLVRRARGPRSRRTRRSATA